MNPELDQFEAELQRLRPAKAPEEFVASLAKPPRRRPPQMRPARERKVLVTWRWLRWLAPAMAMLLVGAILIVRYYQPEKLDRANSGVAVAKPVINADRVDIDRQLLAAFDAVARLPGGEPVRFRCRQWMEEVVLRDTSTGVIVEQQTPRLEIVPVKFETY